MIDFKIVSTNPGIKNFVQQIRNLLELVSIPSQCFVWHSCPYGLGTHINEVKTWKYTKDLIIWVIIDTLIDEHEFDPTSTPVPPMFVELENICRQNPGRQFILFTSQLGFDRVCTVKNLKLIDLPSDTSENILDFPPLKTHNLNINQPTLFLNRSERQHRVISLCYFLSQNLDQFCRFTVGESIADRLSKFERFQNYCFYNMPDTKLWSIMERGFKKIKSLPDYNREFSTQDLNGKSNNFLENYTHFLQEKYAQTCIEIVSHSLFSEPTIHITEKNFQSIYGMNIPIYIASQGTVDYMRQNGFDMFDDVIDHRYDNISNPVERIMAVFDLNRDLLTNPKKIVEAWYSSHDRLQHNINHIPKFIHACERKVETDFLKTIKQLNVCKSNII